MVTFDGVLNGENRKFLRRYPQHKQPEEHKAQELQKQANPLTF